MNGFSGVGLVRPKTEINIGSALRAVHCYDASFLAIEKMRTKFRSPTDVFNTHRNKPVLRVDDLRTVVPFDCVPICVDLTDDAESIVDFDHPQRAFYIFGPEDGTLGKAHTSWAARTIYIPTQDCMNLAATVNVVLYDRMQKQVRKINDHS